IDWNKSYESVGEGRPRRISLPTYPFARGRYWINAAVNGQMAAKGFATEALHPLLHRNTSDLGRQRDSSTFTGEEFFLADHRVRADGHTMQKVLPDVAYLEMARVAMEQAWPVRPESVVLELHHTIWAQPIVVTQDKQI